MNPVSVRAMASAALVAAFVAACGPVPQAESPSDAALRSTDAAGARVIGRPIPADRIAPAPPQVEALGGTFESAFALARALVGAIDAGDAETMLRHRLTESEFYWIVWPELRSNRPEVGMPWDYVWRDMNQKSVNSARFTAAKYQGLGMRLMRVEFDGERSSFGRFTVSRDARCVVQLPDGSIRRLDLFGSVIEMDGRFKAYSLLVD